MGKMEGNSPEHSRTRLYSIKLHGDDIFKALSQRASCRNGWERGQILNLMLGWALPNCATLNKFVNFSLPVSSPVNGSNDCFFFFLACRHVVPIKGLHSVNQALKAEPRLVYMPYNGLLNVFFKRKWKLNHKMCMIPSAH